MSQLYVGVYKAGFPLLRQRVLHREEKCKTKPPKGKQVQTLAA
jgi:hypothetical protein